MKDAVFDWSLCGSFLSVLRTRSLSAAARERGVSQPTVRRHLDMLEARVGAPLFVRSTGGLVPTEAALGLRGPAEAMDAAAAFFLRLAATDPSATRGTVRIAASNVMGIEVLPPILSGMAVRHPGLSFELVPSNAQEDLLRHDADIAVRMVRPLQGQLVARRAATFPLGLFAHRDWIDRHGAPQSLDELAATNCLIGPDRDDATRSALAAMGLPPDRAAYAYRSDDDLAQLAMLRAGLGPGVCQTVVAVRDENLVRVLPHLGHDLDAWVVIHPDIRSSPAVKAVFDGLVQGLAEVAATALRTP